MPNHAERYFNLIEATLRAARQSRSHHADVDDTISLRAGLSFVDSTLGLDANPSPLAIDADRKVVDGFGHARPIYRALLTASLARSNRLASPVPPPADIDFTAANGTDVSLAAWFDLARPPGDRTTISKLIESQLDDGTFLKRAVDDNPEPTWYFESVILHAVATHAADTGDSRAIESTRRGAKLFAREIQPDHASNQPWAIHAFLFDPDAVPLADMMLHTASVQQPTTLDAASLILLADALVSGRRLMEH